VLLSLSLLVSGCVTLKDPEASQIHSEGVVATLQAGHRVGQTFVSRRPGLNGISLWLIVSKGADDPDAKLIVQLYTAPSESEPLTAVTLPLASIALGYPFEIKIPVQPGPADQTYFLSMLATSGIVQVSGRNEDAYAHGSAYLDGAPLDADIAFRLSYDYDWTAGWDDLSGALRQSWLILPLVAVLLLPGWFLLSFLPPLHQKGNQVSGEIFAIMLGLSLAFLPLLMAWTTVLKLQWTRPWALFAAGVMAAFALWRMPIRKPVHFKLDGHSLALLTIFLVALFVRLIMVRDLVAPAWVDSIHHGLITRLIIEQGGYPHSYQPYLDINSASYHPGFHSLLAFFLWLSKMGLQPGMLLLGQVLNASSVIAMYLFTKTLTENRTAGLVAALITGFFTPMPAYYASWGRYTQLTGLLILPTAFALVRSVAYTPGKVQPRSILLAAIACAGLFLVHYRVAVFLACLLIGDFTIRLMGTIFSAAKSKSQIWLREVRIASFREAAIIIAISAASLLMLLSWLPALLSTLVIPQVANLRRTTEPLFSGFAWPFLFTAQGKSSLYMAGLGLLVSLWRKPRLALTLTLWVGLLFLLSNLETLGLFRSFLNNLSVEITLFMPLSVLGGYFISQAVHLGEKFTPARWRMGYMVMLAVLSILAAWYAARQLIPILNPVTFLARQADQPALEWIEAHIPRDETILLNPFAWGYGLYGGNDGGFWITPITGRKTLPPPVLYGFDNSANRRDQINHLCQQVIDHSQDAQALYTLLKEHRIGYIYIGARGGVLSSRLLHSSSFFDTLYHQNGTWVFQLK